MKTKLLSVMSAAAVAGVVVVSPLSAVSAQDADTPAVETPAADATVDEDQKDHGRGHGKGHGKKGHRGHGGTAKVDLAEELGLTADELKDALSNGQSLADVANANGVSTDALIDLLMAPMQARIDAALEAGKIDAETAAAKTAAAEAKIAEHVAKVRPTTEEREAAKAERDAARAEKKAERAEKKAAEGETRGSKGKRGHGKRGHHKTSASEI